MKFYINRRRHNQTLEKNSSFQGFNVHCKILDCMCRHLSSMKVKGDTLKYRTSFPTDFFPAKAQGVNTPPIREFVSQKIGAFWSKNTTLSPFEEISMANTGDGCNKFQFW